MEVEICCLPGIIWSPRSLLSGPINGKKIFPFFRFPARALIKAWEYASFEFHIRYISTVLKRLEEISLSSLNLHWFLKDSLSTHPFLSRIVVIIPGKQLRFVQNALVVCGLPKMASWSSQTACAFRISLQNFLLDPQRLQRRPNQNCTKTRDVIMGPHRKKLAFFPPYKTYLVEPLWYGWRGRRKEKDKQGWRVNLCMY